MDLGFFNKYPYTDFHELNLDWIIEALKRYTKELQDFVQINAIKYADPIQWDIQKQYEKNTVVIDPLNGTAYISVQAVPAGVSLSRPEYWSVIFDLSLFITAANNNFTVRVEPAATTTATFATAAGEWLVWDQKLYKANVNITAGDAYVEGSNITRWTVEEGLQDTNAALAALSTVVGDLTDLTTTDKTSIVNAINDVVAALTTVVNNVGNLASLTTVDKSSIVNAINELVTGIAGIISNIGDLTNLTTVDQSSIVNAVNELVTNIANLVTDMGSLADLTTTDKSSIVNAINELVTSITNSIGNLSDLTTTDKSSIVNAINELVTNIAGLVTDMGNLADLTTTDKSSIVNAINEIMNISGGDSYHVTPQMFGAVGDGINDDTAAVMQALNAAYSETKTLYFPEGTYKCSATLTCTDPQFDIKMDGTLYYTGNGNAFEFNTVRNRNISIRIKHDLPVSAGSALKCDKFYNNNVVIIRIEGFTTALDFHSTSGMNAYNQIYLNHIVNCAVGINLYADLPNGWNNENVFIGGRITVDSSSGIDCDAVVIDSDVSRNYYNNNNVFLKPCVEENRTGFLINRGSFNSIIGGRFENDTTAIRFENRSEYNLVIYGHDIGTVTDNSVAHTNSVIREADYYKIPFKKAFETLPVTDYSFENSGGSSLPPAVFQYRDNNTYSQAFSAHRQADSLASGYGLLYMSRIECQGLEGKTIGLKGYTKYGSSFRYAVKFFNSSNTEIQPATIQANLSLVHDTVNGSAVYRSSYDRTNSTPMQQFVVPAGCAYAYVGMLTQSFVKYEIYTPSTDVPIEVIRVTPQGLNAAPTVLTGAMAGDICKNTGAGTSAGWRFDGSNWVAIS